MPTILEIKDWLKKTRTSRQDLGEKLGVKKRTVDAWLSCGAPIPQAKLALIEGLMQPPITAPAMDLNSVKVINMLMSKEEKAMCKAAAERKGQTLEQWAHDTIMTATARILKEHGLQMTSLPPGAEYKPESREPFA